MTMPWSTQDAEQDALELTDIGTERLLRSLYELESPFFVHLVIEAALLSARVTAYGILVQPQPGFDGEEVNDFVLQRDQLDIDAVVRLEALLAFQHLLLFSEELGLDEAACRAVLGETGLRLWFPAQTARGREVSS